MIQMDQYQLIRTAHRVYGKRFVRSLASMVIIAIPFAKRFAGKVPLTNVARRFRARCWSLSNR